MGLSPLIPAPRPASGSGPTEGVDELSAAEVLELYSRHADDLAAFVEQILDEQDNHYRELIHALEAQRRTLDAAHCRRRRALLMLGDQLGAMNGQLDEAAHRLNPHTMTCGPPVLPDSGTEPSRSCGSASPAGCCSAPATTSRSICPAGMPRSRRPAMTRNGRSGGAPTCAGCCAATIAETR